MSEERKGWGKVDMTQERSVRALLPGGCKFGHGNFHLCCLGPTGTSRSALKVNGAGWCHDKSTELSCKAGALRSHSRSVSNSGVLGEPRHLSSLVFFCK